MRKTGLHFVIIAFSLFFSHAAFSHAALILSSPKQDNLLTEPLEVWKLQFNEPVTPLVLKLVSPVGTSVLLETFHVENETVIIHPPPGLDVGTHVLSWRVSSSDGHPVGGTVRFSMRQVSQDFSQSVHEGTSVVSGLVWLGRCLIYIFLFFGIGGIFFKAWLLPQTFMKIDQFFKPALWAVFPVCVFMLGLQGLDTLGLSLTNIFSLQPWKAAFSTSYYQTLALITVSAVTGLFVVVNECLSVKQKRLLATSALLILAYAFTLSGHASYAEPQILMKFAVFIHMMCLTIWIGSLWPLFVVIKCGNEQAKNVLNRFSSVIVAPFAALILSGLWLTYVQSGFLQKPLTATHITDLVSSSYIQVLIIKLFIVMALTILATYNRFILTPDFNRTCRVPEFKKSLTTEMLLVTLLLGTVAVWRFTPPPRALITTNTSITTHLHGSGVMTNIVFSSNRSGSNQINFQLNDEMQALLRPKEVQIKFLKPDAGLEALDYRATQNQNGNWTVSNIHLPVPGAWTIEIEALISDFKKIYITGTVELAP